MIKETISSSNIKKKIIEADNGVDAVKLFQQHKPDLVILDICMPKADGLQVLRVLFELSRHAKIIIISANENMKFIDQAMRFGVGVFFGKTV